MLAASLVLASSASGAEFTVDTTDDTADQTIDGHCDTDGGGDDTPCTLRAAVAEANATGASDDIVFVPSFNGEAVNDTIELGGALQVNQPVAIDGGDCSVNHEPCVGIRAGSGSPTFDALQVTANDVSVRGVAITNARQGIFYGFGQTGLDVTNSQFGTDLDNVADGNQTAIEAIGGEATIGSANAADRNIFEGNGIGLHLAGNDNVVEGNWFGADTTGTLANATDILIQGSNPDDAPTGNVIGGTPSPSEANSAPCDGPCNVISGATGPGIDLGQGPGLNPNHAADNTTIQGNTIGKRVDGLTAAGNGGNGIDVGEATGTAIGGMVFGQANFIAHSGANGISIENGGSGNTILNNTLNSNAGDAIHLSGNGTDHNVMRGNIGNGNGVGALNPFIDLEPPDGAGNSFNGPNGGVGAPDVVVASTLKAVGVSAPAASVNVYRESSFVQVGEVVALSGTGTATAKGVWVIPYTSPMFSINVATATQTVALGTSEHSIPPPTALVDGSTDSTPPTTGGSTPKAFTSDTTPPITFTSNEAGSRFICRVDTQRARECAASFTPAPLADGKHKVTGQAVDQAANLDTSPFSVTVTVDTVRPNTSITSGPSGATTDRTPTFTLASNETGARFQCSVDGAAFKACRPTATLPKLAFGAHVFRARAVDRAQNIDTTAAQRKFTVVRP